MTAGALSQSGNGAGQNALLGMSSLPAASVRVLSSVS